MLNASIYLLLGILIISCVLMVLIVLMQRPKNEGLGASFGGGMTQDLFGAQTTNVLQKFTVYLGAVFFLVSLLLTVLYSKASTQSSAVQKTLQASAAKAKLKPAPLAATATAPKTDNPATAPVAPAVTSTTPLATKSAPEAAAAPETAPTLPLAVPVESPATTPMPQVASTPVDVIVTTPAPSPAASTPAPVAP